MEGREIKICATDKLYLVKILFEDVQVLRAVFEGREGRTVTESERKRIPDLDSREARGTITMLFSFEEGDAKDSTIQRRHSCQPLLGVTLNPEFVNLQFPYAGQGLWLFRWWQHHFEFQLAHVAVEGRSNVVLNTRAQLQISLPMRLLSLCTRPGSVHLAMLMACVSCLFNSFSVFLLSLKQQNLMKIMFSCIHFPI